MQPKFGHPTSLVMPGSYEIENHFYIKVLNAQLHAMVCFFLNLENSRIVNRYCHLNPQVDQDVLLDIIQYQPRYLRWAGADLFHVTTERGHRRMLVVETNSCPSGQKSMPLLDESQEMGGYRQLLQRTFIPMLQKKRMPAGALAVIYDKNYMEASGYAAAMAELMQEPVYLAGFYEGDTDPPVRFNHGSIMEVRDAEGKWHTIRAAFRYVTQRPWNRIPIETRTLVFNPIIGCLAGGRNKLIAAKAYDMYNTELSGLGLKINTPETILDVFFDEIPLWVQRFGGHAVIKNPYSNAGQGIYTITSERELEAFMRTEQRYQKFIVQSLIGNSQWSTAGSDGKYYHVGTVPSKRNNIYAADVRMMVSGGAEGFRPVAIYARRALKPLESRITESSQSWDMLGTNLSYRKEDGTWGSDISRLKLMDRKDFNMMGISLDNLIDGFIQTVLAVIAIDRMAANLMTAKGKFKKKLFYSLNSDEELLNEIMTGS